MYLKTKILIIVMFFIIPVIVYLAHFRAIVFVLFMFIHVKIKIYQCTHLILKVCCQFYKILFPVQNDTVIINALYTFALYKEIPHVIYLRSEVILMIMTRLFEVEDISIV